MYRQGDVLIRKVRSVPRGAKRIEVKDRIVLAYGEVTGHAHAIHALDDVDVFVTADGKTYLRVKDTVSLKHEEHGAIAIEPGGYEVIIQREYSPEAIRNVTD